MMIAIAIVAGWALVLPIAVYIAARDFRSRDFSQVNDGGVSDRKWWFSLAWLWPITVVVFAVYSAFALPIWCVRRVIVMVWCWYLRLLQKPAPQVADYVGDYRSTKSKTKSKT